MKTEKVTAENNKQKKATIQILFTTKIQSEMKKVIIMFALAMGIATANAQENVTVAQDNGSVEQPTLTKEVYPQKEADGDL